MQTQYTTSPLPNFHRQRTRNQAVTSNGIIVKTIIKKIVIATLHVYIYVCMFQLYTNNLNIQIE